MKNLTEVSLKHKNLIWYFIIVITLGGIFAFQNLGRMEDPAFTIRQMIVSATWPGATAKEVSEFLADPIEKKLQETPGLDYLKSESRPGELRIIVNLKDDVPETKVRDTWRTVRDLSSDVKGELPEGVLGPYFNDRFDDVFGSVYAITGDDYSYEELRMEAEKFRRSVLKIKSVQKAEIEGEQRERIYVEFSSEAIGNLGVTPAEIQNVIREEMAKFPTGDVSTEDNRVFIRYSGDYSEVSRIKNLPIPIGGKVIKLADIAKVSLRTEEPAAAKMFYNGKKSIGIKVAMENGGNVIELGKDLDQAEEEMKKNLPLGMELFQVANQPSVVKDSIAEFTKTLFEAIVIVLLVSFFTLGTRTGLVVAFSIPLVLAAVFLFMYITGIDLHKVSLGALIISLGLLVDDAIIAVEMMSVKLEEGLSKFDAACYAFRETAMPMLTGTLITVSGFIPVAFSKGLASEFCVTLFPVIGAALVVSWIVSVMVAPFFGTYLIKAHKKEAQRENKFYKYFRMALSTVLDYPKLTITVTVIIFAISIFSFGFIKREFFPPSVRPELLVNLTLSRGSSKEETERVARDFAKYVDKLDGVKHYSYYVGKGAPRFVLTIDPELPDDNFAQFVIVGNSAKDREKIQIELDKILREHFYTIKNKMQLLQTGPPAKAPVMLRISADNFEDTKKASLLVMNYMFDKKLARDITSDMNEEGRILKLNFDEDRLAAMGLTKGAVSKTLYGYINGAKIAEFYRHGKTVQIQARSAQNERSDLFKLNNLLIGLPSGGYIPLSNVGFLKLETEPMLIVKRNLRETATLMGELPANAKTANDATAAALKEVTTANLNLPENAKIEAAGALEDSAKSLNHLLKPIPLMIFVIMTLLMLQLKNLKDMMLTLLTAPLGLIGVSFGMLVFDAALGFVAELGILALFGMIIRNSVILIDQIKKHIARGDSPYDAIIDSAVLRFRPIMLTAAAAILGMLPLMASSFWAPMAAAIASGLFVATILTLLILPAMYALAYNIKKGCEFSQSSDCRQIKIIKSNNEKTNQ